MAIILHFTGVILAQLNLLYTQVTRQWQRSSLIGSFTTRISAHILCVGKFKMAARFAEPTKVEIVALFEKATPENTKKATEY